MHSSQPLHQLWDSSVPLPLGTESWTWHRAATRVAPQEVGYCGVTDCVSVDIWWASGRGQSSWLLKKPCKYNLLRLPHKRSIFPQCARQKQAEHTRHRDAQVSRSVTLTASGQETRGQDQGLHALPPLAEGGEPCAAPLAPREMRRLG